jgi:glycosyltransferase involved in cell wall biosynthesis
MEVPMTTPVADETRPACDNEAEPGRPLIAVAIPSYNEDRFIGSVVLKALRYAELVLVVDDGSADQTAAIATAAGALVIRHDTNKGKASGINTAFQWAMDLGVAALVLIDGDGQHAPDEIPALVAPVLQGEADMVVGTRFGTMKSAIPGYRQVGQRALTTMTNISSGLQVSDSQSGFRAFSPRALKQMRFQSRYFAIESEMQFIAKQEGLHVAEVPISAIYAEPAKRNPVRHGVSVVQSLVNMFERQRPLLSFGFLGIILVIVGILLGFQVTALYASSQELAVGHSLMTVLFIIIGVVTTFVGVILHSLRTLLNDLREV